MAGILAILSFMMLLTAAAYSHQPFLLMNTNFTEAAPYVIHDPEVSKGFYCILKGRPDHYQVVLDKPLLYYINILTPDITNHNTNRFSIAVYEKTANGALKQVFLLDGYGQEWGRYYEKFGQDWYRKGPEARVQMKSNTVYILKVFSKSNRGRYALATGEVEEFPLWEILRIVGILPELHRDFFDKK